MELIEVTDEQGNYYKYKKYNGRPFFPEVIGNVRDQLQMLENYDFKEDDVFLCTFPKSGTHWVHNIINMLRTGTVKYNAQHVTLECHEKDQLDRSEHPRTFVTHLTYDILPSSIKQGVGKIVYLIRNPKDVFISLKHFLGSLTKRHSYDGTMDGLLRFFLSDDFFGLGGSWFTYTREWEEGIRANGDIHLHFVKCEDLKKNPFEEIEKLAKFLEIDFDDSFLSNVVENVSFDQLKTMHATKAGVNDRWTEMCENGRLPIYRKGIIGDWKKTLTVSQNEVFDSVIQQKLAGLNIELTYE